MKTYSKSYGEELEIYKMKESDGLTITVEVFKVPEGFKSFARDNLFHHDDLLGSGMHKNKQESIDLAIQDLHQLIEELSV